MDLGPNGGGEPPDEEIRTLFISGLPVDVKERELHNLFRPYEYYEGALIKFNQKLGIPIAFASFQNQAAALEAKEKLHGIRFDPESSTELRLELAKSNTRTKRLRDLTEGLDSTTKRTRVAGYSGYPPAPPASQYGGGFSGQTYYDHGPNSASWGGYGGGYDAYGPPSGAVPGYSMHYGAGYGSPTQPQWGQRGGPLTAPIPPGPPPPANITPPRGPRPVDGSNLPNSTLFVANLALTVSEMELRDVFSRVPGCRRVKVLQKSGSAPTAFVEFSDVPTAMACREAMDGTFAHYTDRSGLRVEFAKRKMGQPGRFTDTSTFANPEGVHPNVLHGGGLSDLGGDAAASTYAIGYTPSPIAPPMSGLM